MRFLTIGLNNHVGMRDSQRESSNKSSVESIKGRSEDLNVGFVEEGKIKPEICGLILSLDELVECDDSDERGGR